MKKTIKAVWIIMASFLIFGSVIFLGCSSDNDHRQIEADSPATDESVADYPVLITENSEATYPDNDTDDICDIENDTFTQPSLDYTSTDREPQLDSEQSSVTNELGYQHVDGVIFDDLYFNDIEISRFFSEPFYDILGVPLSYRSNFVFYEGIEFGRMWVDDSVLGDSASWILISSPNMAKINDVTLNLNRTEVIETFGIPREFYGVQGWISYPTPGDIAIRYHMSSYPIDFHLEIWFYDCDDESEVNIISIHSVCMLP